ncbi:MAG: MFS transporter [Promethearchaeota archaeon]
MSEFSPPIPFKTPATECNAIISYRAWPIFLLSFIRLFSISIFERAFLNYIYFYQNVSESIFGYINSAPAVAYILGPIVGQLITYKFGVRNSIILSCITTPVILVTQMIYFDPIYLIFIRIISGIQLGIYWPNCYNLLSKWQSVSNEKKSTKNFRTFNFSWNIGFITGLLFGYFWAFSLNEYFTMFLAWMLSFFLIPFAFFIKKDTDLKSSDQNATIFINSEDKLGQKSNNKMIVFPILFSWLALIGYTMAKSLFRFNYPIFLKAFGGPSYYAYLIQLAVQIGQLVGLTWTNYMKIHTRKISVLISLTLVILSALLIILFHDLFFISIISATTGLYVGLIQGVSLKIMIDYGAEQNKGKYSTINEVLKGLGFGLLPIAAGYIAELNLYAIFGFIIIFGIGLLIPIIYLSRNIKNNI